mgnify:CR=1 FL=1
MGVELYCFPYPFFLLGFVTGSYLPSILPIITETYEYRHGGKTIGFHDSAASFSIFFIPLLVSFGMHYLSWRNILLIFGVGFVPFLLGVIADHLNFEVGILGLGILTTLSSLMVRFLRDE